MIIFDRDIFYRLMFNLFPPSTSYDVLYELMFKRILTIIVNNDISKRKRMSVTLVISTISNFTVSIKINVIWNK
jgi:hypothetical protein